MATEQVDISKEAEEIILRKHIEALQAEARSVLEGTKEERIAVVFSDKFALHDEAKAILSKFKDAFSRPKSERPIGFALAAPTSSGKTALTNRFCRDLGGDPLKQVGVHERMPLLVATCPERSTEPRLILALANALRVPLVVGGLPREVSDLVKRRVREKEVRMMILHEFGNIAPLPRSEREVVYDLVRNLCNSGIVVVAVGTEEIISLIQEDEELASRLRPLRLRGFALDQRFGSFLATLETFFPLPKPSFLPRYAIEIHRRTAGIIGEVVALLNEAAAWAIRNDRGLIDDEALKKCAYIPPANLPAGLKL